MGLYDVELYKHLSNLPVRQLLTEMVIRGLVDYAGYVDLYYSIDYRVSCMQLE